MKKFYTQVTVENADTGFAIALDGRLVKTPGKSSLIMPTQALASEVAAEWDAQGEEIDTNSMPVTRLANTALDRVKPRMAQVAADVCAFAGTDLLCYRADDPIELFERQKQVWDPYLEWAEARYSARLEVTSGIMPVAQSKTVLTRLSDAVRAYDAFELTALHEFTNGFGSLVLGLAYMEDFAPFEALWDASFLEQSFQEEQWGEDYEVIEKKQVLRADLDAACKFFSQVRNKTTSQGA